MYEQYTNKLKPKLAKLGWGKDVTNINIYPSTCKMIATIYRSAYIRGQLGRNFIIGETKQTEHWVPATKDNVKVGSKVRMIDDKGHRSRPWYFPDVGTIGTVTEVGFHIHLIQWPEETTSGTDKWYCDDTLLEVLLCE